MARKEEIGTKCESPLKEESFVGPDIRKLIKKQSFGLTMEPNNRKTGNISN